MRKDDSASTEPSTSEAALAAVHERALAQFFGLRSLVLSTFPEIDRQAHERLDGTRKELTEMTRHLRKLKKQRSQAREMSELSARATVLINRSSREIIDLLAAPPQDLFLRALFLASFSTFDAFIGDLLRTLLKRHQNLILARNLSFTLPEVVKLGSVDAVVQSAIESTVDGLQRDGYSSQLDELAKIVGLKSLSTFDRYPAFIESSQRRNVVAHCDGVSTRQYREECKKAGVPQGDIPELGKHIPLSVPYVVAAIDVLIEVSLGVTFAVMSAVSIDGAQDSSDFLNNAIYSILSKEHWALACTISSHYTGKARHFIKSDVALRMIVVNHAISLCELDKPKDAVAVLQTLDWSAAPLDLRLANAVVRGEWRAAAALMEKIGKNGIWIKQDSYRSWPLMRRFRATSEFNQAYVRVYGAEFSAPLERIVKTLEEKAREAERQVEEGGKALAQSAGQKPQDATEGQISREETEEDAGSSEEHAAKRRASKSQRRQVA